MFVFPKNKKKEALMTFPESKKKKKNELTFSFVQEPFVRLRPFVQAPFLKKKKKRGVKKKKERTYLFVRSGTVLSASPVRLGSISKKKKKEDVNYVL